MSNSTDYFLTDNESDDYNSFNDSFNYTEDESNINDTAGNITDIRNTTRKPIIFDNVEVRAIFLTMYTVVFCFCFFGNMIVILVLTVSRRLRSITNFFLANLAVADMCVGVFCVYENLFLFIMAGENWVFGVALCKMYMFMHNLSYTASILILMVICLERYVAIIHPIACRQILTHNRLVLVVVVVWFVAGLYSLPRLAWMNVYELRNGILCVPAIRDYNMLAFDSVNLLVLYVVPLMVMSALYTVIAYELWHSAAELNAATAAAHSHVQAHVAVGHGAHPLYGSVDGTPAGMPRDSTVSLRTCLSRRLSRRLRSAYSSTQAGANGTSVPGGGGGGGGGCGGGVKAQPEAYHVSSSQNVLRARRGVVRMLIVVVITFALCNLPIHARKMWQHGGNAWGYYGDSPLSQVLTVVSFLLTYVNSAINPLLYAFMSRNFRKGLREVLCGPLRSGRPAVLAAPTSSILRRSSTRSTSRAVSVVTVHS